MDTSRPPPFADPEIYENEDLLSIVFNLLGKDAVMPQLATDTPLYGSDYRDIHRDTLPLFPETGVETPPYQLAVNFPPVDVTEEMGPFEVARGTHMMTKEEGMRRLESREISLEPVPMRLGDVMIRDVRGPHRCTPNRTTRPRPMVVIGYSRHWLYPPEVSIRQPRSVGASCRSGPGNLHSRLLGDHRLRVLRHDFRVTQHAGHNVQPSSLLRRDNGRQYGLGDSKIQAHSTISILV